MKKIIAVLLLLCLLCACSSAPETTESSSVPAATPTPTPAATATPTPTPTPEPTPTPIPVGNTVLPYEYWNPLTGEELSEPHTSRLYAVTINNVPPALPHYGVGEVDIFFEMLVNDYATRGLALYADTTGVGPVGSIRSNRYNFTDICASYDAIIAHASASAEVMQDTYNRVDNLDADTYYFYRDQGRANAGYAYEHTLFVNGEDLPAYAADKGYRTEVEAGTQYGLTFVEEVTLEGETAESISFWFWDNSRGMEYNADTDKYEFWQYGDLSYDGISGEAESFKNVLLLQMTIDNSHGVYHLAQLNGSGEGYYATGGKIVPIQWHHEDPNAPFLFTYADGTPLNLEVGNSYIGFVPVEDEISWE